MLLLASKKTSTLSITKTSTFTILSVTQERKYDEDKPIQVDTIIWHKAGKNPKMGKTLDRIFL